MLISYSYLAWMSEHNLPISISKIHRGIVITLTGNKIRKVQTALCIDTVTFAAGDLCITAVRAWMVDTAKESRCPWNTWKEQVQKSYTNMQRQFSSKICAVPSCQEENQEFGNMLQKSSPHQSKFQTPQLTRNYITADTWPQTSKGEKHSQHKLHLKYSDGQTSFPHASNGQPQEGGRKTIRKSLAVCVLLENQHLQLI